MKVYELEPGDVVEVEGLGRACFVTDTAHPVWPMLRLVIWRLDQQRGGGWSLDALNARQDVGLLVERGGIAGLRRAFGAGEWEATAR